MFRWWKCIGLLSVLVISACASSMQDKIRSQVIHTWADLPDGKKEWFTASAKDVHYVDDDHFYVTSPTGQRVYFQQWMHYYELTGDGQRKEYRLDGTIRVTGREVTSAQQ